MLDPVHDYASSSFVITTGLVEIVGIKKNSMEIDAMLNLRHYDWPKPTLTLICFMA